MIKVTLSGEVENFTESRLGDVRVASIFIKDLSGIIIIERPILFAIKVLWIMTAVLL